MAKMKSPNYPAIGLSQAIESVRQFWNKEKKTAVSPEVAVKAMGYTGLNGHSLTRLSALKKYGLLDSEGKSVRVSQLAMTIIHSPDDSQEQRKAVLEAAMKPDIFRELYETHLDASDEALKAHLVLKKGFTEAGAKQFIAAFRDTLVLAKPSDAGYDAGKKLEEGNMSDAGMGHGGAGAGTLKQQIRVFSWPLSKDVSVEVRLTGAEDIKPSHLERLRQYLELAKAAVSGEDEQE